MEKSKTMKLVILGATGGTGRAMTQQALAQGHTVLAVVRDPAAMQAMASPRLEVAEADVYDSAAFARAIGPDAVVLSALGGKTPHLLEAGARAVLAARPQRILWLGAYGSGASAAAAGWATRAVLSLMGDRLVDKVTADTLILQAGGTVFHAGPLLDAPLSAQWQVVELAHAPKRLFPARIPRPTVAAAMLAEAVTPRYPGRTVVPLGG